MALRISKAGLESMEKQLENLKKELCELGTYKGSVAIHSGDAWHDNNDFEQCEIDERRLQRQISDLTEKINSAIIIDSTSQNENIVDFGARVTIQLTLDGEVYPEDIVLFSDSCKSSELLTTSANSPLGSTIYQKEVGFIGSYKVNGNTFNVKILKIEY